MEYLLGAIAFGLNLYLLLEPETPPSLWPYFLLMAMSWVGGYAARYTFGDESWQYLIFWCGITALILGWVVLLAVLALKSISRYPWRLGVTALFISGIFARLAYVYAEPLTAAQWAVLVEALVLVWAGTISGGCAPYIKNGDLYFGLGLFWLAQGLADYGWLLHWEGKSSLWQEASWIFGPSLCIAVFAFLAWRLHGKREFA